MLSVPDAARPLETTDARFTAVRDYDALTRDAFDALTGDARAVILAELRTVAGCGATRPHINRWGRESTRPAGYVTRAGELVDRFTGDLPPRVDMSTEAVAARVLAATHDGEVRGIAGGLTIDAIQRVSVANQWGRGSDGWKRARHVDALVERARLARIERARDTGDDAALWREYERARDDAARMDKPAPTRADMRPRVEVFRGRKLRTEKGPEWGTITQHVNGYVSTSGAMTHGSGPEGLDKAAAQLRREVIAADEQRITRPDAWPTEWFTGAPTPDPAIVAYCMRAAAREEADRAAIFAPSDEDAAPDATATAEQLERMARQWDRCAETAARYQDPSRPTPEVYRDRAAACRERAAALATPADAWADLLDAAGGAA
jgi:hypothetical protein